VICIIVVLDFVHCLNYIIIKLQYFGSWILLPSSGKKVIGSGLGLRLAQNLASETLQFYNLDDGQSPKEQFYIFNEIFRTFVRDI
jgi:hypothetical protein